MSVLADSLPDDLGTLKAMLIAERTQNERLRQHQGAATPSLRPAR
jgi:hypothetical protein